MTRKLPALLSALVAACLLISLEAGAEGRSIVLSKPTPLRRDASASSQVLGTYPAGTRLTVTGERNGWYSIRFSRPYKGVNTAWILASDVGEDDLPPPSDEGQGYERSSRRSSGGGSGGFIFGVNAGYGFDDLFKLGGGVHLGTRLSEGLYLGARFDYFLGTSESARVGTTTYTASANALMPAVEVGYDIRMNGFFLRPVAGIGYAMAVLSSNFIGNDAASSIAFYPGLLFSTDGPTAIGLEMNYRILDGGGVFVSMLRIGFGG